MAPIEESEREFLKGQRSVWARLLRMCMAELGYDSRIAGLIEREEIISILREVCKDHGDNNWEEDLNLADIIDKHLYRHLKE